MGRHMVIHCAGCNRYRKRDERIGPCRCGGKFVLRAAKPMAGRKMPLRVPMETRHAMRKAYERGLSLAAVGRMFPHARGPRSHTDIREYLVSVGTEIRATKTSSYPRDARTGSFVRQRVWTRAKIAALCAKVGSFRVPSEIKHQWREWPMEKRAWLLGLLRKRWPSRLPAGAFSANVTPFDYATPAAWEILRRANAGLNARHWKTRLFPISEGVIFEGRLWFWSDKVGYQVSEWTPGHGRPALHHVLWERAHGCAVPTSCVVRHADGNWNNLDPANLVLATRNELARENQAAALTRRSREMTKALLSRHTRKISKPNDDDHAKDNLLETIKARR